MNCQNHPDVPAAAYCQSCGKPLCTACMRSVGGSVFCEPCLAARLSASQGGAFPNAPATGIHAHPLLAGLLGFIPGVGAMYNGQFAKALAHVLIFAVFVSLSDKSAVFGLLVAAWIFYQVFDAAQTAKARRDGFPLPNPFGLNDLGSKLGMAPAPASAPYGGGFTAPPAPSSAPYSGPDPVAGPPFQAVPPVTSGYPPSPATGAPLLPEPRTRRYPVGAIVLIVVGGVLLLQTLGIFEDEWIGRAWPLIIIGVGVWLLYRKTLDTRRGPQ
jgi:Domain of unknown function (DUF5668)/B-box zinc finger